MLIHLSKPKGDGTGKKRKDFSKSGAGWFSILSEFAKILRAYIVERQFMPLKTNRNAFLCLTPIRGIRVFGAAGAKVERWHSFLDRVVGVISSVGIDSFPPRL